MCMKTLSQVLEEFDLLRALEVERLQLGAIAFWQRHQIGVRFRPVWIHGEPEMLDDHSGDEEERKEGRRTRGQD